jgi:hypothetical protein
MDIKNEFYANFVSVHNMVKEKSLKKLLTQKESKLEVFTFITVLCKFSAYNFVSELFATFPTI